MCFFKRSTSERNTPVHLYNTDWLPVTEETEPQPVSECPFLLLVSLHQPNIQAQLSCSSHMTLFHPNTRFLCQKRTDIFWHIFYWLHCSRKSLWPSKKDNSLHLKTSSSSFSSFFATPSWVFFPTSKSSALSICARIHLHSVSGCRITPKAF